MKNYNQFLNEINIGYSNDSDIKSYNFFISFKYSDRYEKKLIFDKLKKFITDESKLDYYINTISYFWKIELINFNGNLFIDLDIKPKRGNHENELKVSEFLEVGLEGVKEYIEKKKKKKEFFNNVKKYNL